MAGIVFGIYGINFGNSDVNIGFSYRSTALELGVKR